MVYFQRKTFYIIEKLIVLGMLSLSLSQTMTIPIQIQARQQFKPSSLQRQYEILHCILQ